MDIEDFEIVKSESSESTSEEEINKPHEEYESNEENYDLKHEKEFKTLILDGFTAIDALCKMYTNVKVFDKFRMREGDPKDFIIELTKKFGDGFYEKYFKYTSGLQRTEIPFIKKNHEIKNVEVSDYKIFSSSDLRKIKVIRERGLFPIVPTLDNFVYHYEPESDYFLIINSVLRQKLREPLVIAEVVENGKKQNVDVVLVRIEKKHYLLVDTTKSYNRIVHRKWSGVVTGTIRYNILQELSMNNSIYSVLSKIVKQISSLVIRTVDSWREVLANIGYASLLEESPDKTPACIKSLLIFGVPYEIIMNYIVYASGRPKTNMPFIEHKRKKETFQGYTILDKHQKQVISTDLKQNRKLSGKFLIPVVRYQKGMSRGAYYRKNSTEKKYVGTFYYFEPDSEYYLECNTLMITSNKMTGYYILTKNSLSSKEAALENIERNFLADPDYIIKTPEGNKKVSELGTAEQIFDKMLIGDKNVLSWNKQMYAEEDEFDQELTQTAFDEEIGVVILISMTGKNRIVSEVLDSRPREVSFNNIFKKPEIIEVAMDTAND